MKIIFSILFVLATFVVAAQHPQESGDRRSLIKASTNLQMYGDITTILDGNNNQFANVYFLIQPVAGKEIKFDFTVPVNVVEVLSYASYRVGHGNWIWQGSNDETNWSTISPMFNFRPTDTIQLENKNYYRYYRMFGLSGSSSNVPYIYEFEFKINDGKRELVEIKTDSLTVYFPDRIKLQAIPSVSGLKYEWFTTDGSGYFVYGKDSSVALFELTMLRGTATVKLRAIKDRDTVLKSVSFTVNYNPWRLHKRVPLGELGELIIMSNGEYLFSGPVYFIPGVTDKPVKENAPLIWLNVDTAGPIKTDTVIQAVKEVYKSFDVEITTDTIGKTKGRKVQEIALTQNNEWYGSTTEGGFSYVGLFGLAKAFVFTKLLQYSTPRIIYTTIHEIGHTLGLKHQSIWTTDCKLANKYNTGNDKEAPWMGYVSAGKKGTWIIGSTSWHCSDIQNDSLKIVNYLKTLQ